MIKQAKAWALVLFGALFFFYGFFQVNMMSALEESLIKEFETTASWIGLLSGNFFYATIIFILPAGLMLDRYPVRYLMLFNMGLAIIGVLLFAMATSITMAAVARFISGIMMAFCMISSMKRASILLPAKSMSLASSLILTIGMLGGLCANIVMESLVTSFGWRAALFIVAGLGVLIAIIISICDGRYGNLPVGSEPASIGKSVVKVLKEKQNWLCGFFICFLNLPLAILGALFGISYLDQVFKVPKLEAAAMTSLLFLGLIFGTAFFGWLTNLMRRNKPAMIGGSVFCLIFILALLFGEEAYDPYFFLMMFLIGFMSGAQVLGYPVIIENNTHHLTATALGFASILIMGIGYGLGLPFVGWLLDMGWDGKLVDGVPFYSEKAYTKAFLTIPIGILIGLIFVFFMKEKKKEKRHDL